MTEIQDTSTGELSVAVVEAIKTIFDPEIPINIYDLGLIYQIQANPDDSVYVQMTLTAPNCPAAGYLPYEVEAKIRAIPEVSDVRLDLTFEPPFTMEMMSEAAKLELGFL